MIEKSVISITEEATLLLRDVDSEQAKNLLALFRSTVTREICAQEVLARFLYAFHDRISFADFVVIRGKLGQPRFLDLRYITDVDFVACF
jgi:hypothetical protein